MPPLLIYLAGDTRNPLATLLPAKIEMYLKKIGYSSAASLLSQIVTAASVFVVSPAIIRGLGPEQYGLWLLAISLCAYLSNLDLGVQDTAMRFLAATDDAREPEKRAALYYAFLRFYSRMGALITLIGSTIIGGALLMGEANKYYSLALCCGVLSLSTSIVFLCRPRHALLRAAMRQDIISTIAISRVALFTAGVLLVSSSLDLWTFVLLHVATALGEQFAVYLTARRFVPDPPDRRDVPLDLPAVRAHARTNIMGKLAGTMFSSSNYQILAAFASLGAVTQYGIGMRLPTMFADIITALFGSHFIALFGHLQVSSNRSQQLNALRESQKVSVGCSLSLAVPIFCLTPYFITRWLGDGFSEAAAITQILIFPLALAYSTAPTSCFLIAASKHRCIAYWTLASGILCAAASLFFVGRLGTMGVIIPNALLNTIWPFALAWSARSITGWSMLDFVQNILFQPALLILGLCTPLCWIITRWIQPETYFKMIYTCIIMGILLIPIAFYYILDHTTRNRLVTAIYK